MKTLCTVLVGFLLISVLVKPRLSINIENLSSPLHYSTTQLKELRPPCLVRSSGVYVNNNGNHNNRSEAELTKQIKRGRRGGVRARIRRRPFKPFLPTVVIGNTRSLQNKIDELNGNVQYLHQYREVSIICVTETWFTPEMTNRYAAVNEFNLYRADRDTASALPHVVLLVHLTSRVCTAFLSLLVYSLWLLEELLQ